jgi:hypothetical protein
MAGGVANGSYGVDKAEMLRADDASREECLGHLGGPVLAIEVDAGAGTPPDWFDVLRRDVSRLADDRPLPARRGRKPAASLTGSAAAIGWRYAERPVLNAFAADAEQFDLALRRAALAVYRRWPIDIYFDEDIRIPRRLGLQLEAARPGSLDVMVAIPVWIVAALASQPATAIANLLALLSEREAVRVQIRRWVLTDEELRTLEAASRPAVDVPPPEEREGHDADIPNARVLTPPEHEGLPRLQDPLPGPLAEALHRQEPVVDVEIGHVRVRSARPDIDVVVRSGAEVTAVSIREPKR